MKGAKLISHWAFDEGIGTTAIDSSGNGHDGTIYGDPSWSENILGRRRREDEKANTKTN